MQLVDAPDVPDNLRAMLAAWPGYQAVGEGESAAKISLA